MCMPEGVVSICVPVCQRFMCLREMGGHKNSLGLFIMLEEEREDMKGVSGR